MSYASTVPSPEALLPSLAPNEIVPLLIGATVDEVERELVLQPFYRALGTNVDGSGLGLAIVEEIAKQHGATVTIEDAVPGHSPPGTRVTIRFMGFADLPLE